jgi:hypothetical protein
LTPFLADGRLLAGAVGHCGSSAQDGEKKGIDAHIELTLASFE